MHIIIQDSINFYAVSAGGDIIICVSAPLVYYNINLPISSPRNPVSGNYTSLISLPHRGLYLIPF